MCNKRRLVYIEIVSKEYKQQIKCFLEGAKSTDGHLVLTARQLISKIKSGEIDVVNMEITESGELQHKFGLLNTNSKIDVSSLIEDAYVVGVDEHQFDLRLDHSDTYRLIGKSGIIKEFKELNKQDLVGIIQSGIKIANVELETSTEESVDERRGKRVIVYKEEVVIKAIEEKVDEIKRKNPNILCNDEINPIIHLSQLEPFWKLANVTADIAKESLNEKLFTIYSRYINSKLRYLAFVVLSDTELAAWQNILNKLSDAAYQHDMTIIGEKNFLKLFPYEKDKFKNCIHNLVWSYGEQFMKEFLIHPVETVKKYNVPIDIISSTVIWE